MAGRQRGVVLVVVLVILLAVTLLGTVVMQGATLQTKMVGNSQARQQAFNAAEATLAAGEQALVDMGLSQTTPLKTTFKNDCAPNGLCFAGDYTPGSSSSQSTCTLLPIPTQEVWEDATLNVWNTANRHKEVPVPNMTAKGKYIVEFRCFIDGAGKVIDGKGDALFRITAQGYNESGDSTVMVQSTYRIKLP